LRATNQIRVSVQFLVMVYYGTLLSCKSIFETQKCITLDDAKTITLELKQMSST